MLPREVLPLALDKTLKRMGFSHDPGPLPFVTIRRQQWANRTWPGEVIEIHGEHGCSLPAQPAKVEKIEDFTGECPAHLASVYKGQRLVALSLVAPD